jgi:hypothetical protein
VHDGFVMATVLVQVPAQFPLVAVTVSVKELAVPAFTEIDEPALDPLIVPPEVTDHANVASPAPLDTVNALPLEDAHTASGPLMVHVGGRTGFVGDERGSVIIAAASPDA